MEECNMTNISKWIKTFSFLILGTALMMAFGCESLPKTKQQICLAKKGVSLMKVVLNSTNAIPAEKTAARELTTYLEKITGAKFEIIEEKDLPSGVPAIYLGVTKYAGAQGIDFSKLSSEESVLRTVGKNLVLAGGRPRGTLYAVYEFQGNDLGCRWYTPWCEKVPSQSTCSIPVMNQRGQPYFRLRSQNTHVADRFFAFEKDQWKMFNVRSRLNETSTYRAKSLTTVIGMLVSL